LHFLGFLRDESLHFLLGLQRISLQQMQLGFDLLPVAQILPHGRMGPTMVGNLLRQSSQQIAIVQIGAIDAQRFEQGLFELPLFPPVVGIKRGISYGRRHRRPQ